MGGVKSSLIEENRLYNNWQVVSRTERLSNIVKDRKGRLGE
jgi:hypothetical protein